VPKANDGKVRVSIVKAGRSERVVWILPVLSPLNGRFVENRRIAEVLVLQVRTNSACAIAASAKGRIVRIADRGWRRCEGLLCLRMSVSKTID
jgi:hypothetical protein